METVTVTLTEFIAQHRITMRYERVDQNKNVPDWTDADHWKVTLERKWTNRKTSVRCTKKTFPECACGGMHDLFFDSTARMTTYFSMGYGHNGAEPTAADVLDCLSSDASSIENSAFYEWANDMGYDSDSRKAEKTYKAIEHGTARLRKFLGDDAFDQLLWHTERL